MFQELRLSNNEIRKVPSSIANLRNLRLLTLSKNKIEHLPLQMADMTIMHDVRGEEPNEVGMRLHDNPLTFAPIEVVKKGVEEIAAFLRRRSGVVTQTGTVNSFHYNQKAYNYTSIG